jgi:hypothetical protein
MCYTEINWKHVLQQSNMFCRVARWNLTDVSEEQILLGLLSSSEMAVYFQRTTRRYIPEDISLHNHRCQNLNS